MTHRHDFADVTNKEAWLPTAALNVLRNRWRRARVVGRVMPRLRAELRLDLGPDAPEDHVAIVEALGRLSPPYREAVVLHYIADLTVAEISRELGIPAGTVKARLSRARTHLSGLLQDEEVDHA